MNMTGKADASTSTDDIQGRPLCLFYFTHPFGVLSPDPPTLAAAPADISQAFLNMEPIPTYNLWGQTPSDDYNTSTSSSAKPEPSYELGSISRKPLNIVSYGINSASNVRYPSSIDLDSSFIRKDSISSSLFSSDFTEPMWSFPNSSSKKDYQDKRLHLPYSLPPLDMPLKQLPSTESVNFWEARKPAKLSLPPIEMPAKERRQKSGKAVEKTFKLDGGVEREVSESVGKRTTSRNGVSKSRRRMKRSGIRRMVTCLIQRAVKGGDCEVRGSPAPGPAPVIQQVLSTIREAWVDHKSLHDRSRTVTAASGSDAAEHVQAAMSGRQPLVDALTPRPGASPGLMRRRYSMPETIMRKYRLAQLRSDSEDSLPATAPSRAASPASTAQGSCASLCEPPTHRFVRRDRELMRKSAMLRRLWGSGRQTGSNSELAPCPSCSCEAYSDRDLYDSHTEYGRESRSLDGSRAELRHASGGLSRSLRAKDSHPSLTGWATPKRQRMESPSGLNSSDEMLRTAMRNSYREEQREREKREEPPSSDSTFQSHGLEPSSGEVSRFTETPESADVNQPPKKRRQSVCIYMNNLESPSVEIKSETVTDTPETTDSYTIPNSSEQTATSNSTFVTSEISSTNVYSETSTCYLDSNSTGDVKYRDSLEVTESSNSRSEEEATCVTKIDTEIKVISKEKIKPKSPSKIKESTVEILEIVVSETLNSSAFDDNKAVPAIENTRTRTPKSTMQILEVLGKVPVKKQPIDLDQYVSNILVESLNSLTDQIEGMNASMGSDHKISIIEKEIKVKLQNTGMNTIVHLSPNSNNPIIFGNEELYDKTEEDEVKNAEIFEDKSISDRGTIKIELTDNNDLRLTDSSENVTHISAKELENDNELSSTVVSNENINKTVLQQIQKLFQDGLEFESKLHYPGKMVPEISHIEISNVDVFIDDNSDPNYTNDRIELNTDRNSCNFDCSLDNGLTSLSDSVLGEVGTGAYFKEPTGSVLVPRFSAFPNTDSMEVNTSSDEAEAIGSDCTSLVDSLDDPNSPRNIMIRRAYSSRRNELVRSAIDVLDLLPEMSQSESKARGGEKSEAFFIRIRDNDCDCEKENVVVADHMPDKIKQRLYRRHRKRELRMEYAKRKKVRQIKRDIDKQRTSENDKSKKEIEKDCTVILQSLIDEVVTKIAQEEHKYMRIKQNTNNGMKKVAENTSVIKKPKSHRKTDDISNLESFKVNKNGDVHFCSSGNDKDRKIKNDKVNCEDYKRLDKNLIRGKLSLQPHTQVTPEVFGPKRIYQKSEIHDGSKCIEILEILEYVDSSQSSPDTTNSDENQNHKRKHRKSRIPIPIYERIHRIPRSKNIQRSYMNSQMVRSSPNLKFENLTNYNMDNIIADILIDAINDNVDESSSSNGSLKSQSGPARRASVPQQEPHRSRSNSLRFKQMFDIIPEEKSSLSVESSNEDINLNRRVSASVLASKFESNNNDKREDKIRFNSSSNGSSKLSKSTSTSPSLEEGKCVKKNVMTSPIRKTASAATSPIFLPEDGNSDNNKNGEIKHTSSAKKSLSSKGTKEGWVGFYKPNKQFLEEEGNIKEVKTKTKSDFKSTHTQYDVTPTQCTVRTIESENTTKQIIINHEKSRASSEKLQTVDIKNRKEDTNKSNSITKEGKRRTEKNKIDFLDKLKSKEPKSKRETKMVHSLSDPQTREEFVFQKKDTKKIQMISLEKSEEETIHSKSLKLPLFKDKFDSKKTGDTSSDTDSDSAKSLLCSLAPKWLSMGSGARQKRQLRKKTSQDQPGHQNSAGGWSVTVAGNCYTALPADVEMRLSFPKTQAQQITSHSDSGFGEDFKTRRPIAAKRESSCKCRHCDDCTCSKVNREQESSARFLPPAGNRKLTLMMKKESSGSSILGTKSLKKQNESLPEVETYKNSKSKTKGTVKSRRRYSLHCWLPADEGSVAHRRPRRTDELSVLGCAIIPEMKPRVPTMSERDLTRVYTPRHYLRS